MDTLAALDVSFPPELPITERVGELTEAIEQHQVVVVAGETGSGKSTQLPKICLAMGRGTSGRIGHTQPRRLAARSVAERVAEELSTGVGEVVGYAVRFTDRVGRNTRVKLMTDGILLAEIQRDRLLSAYDTLIIDEAHERSLNIDFLLGYIKQLLPRRPDLRVIITSATIDTERFSQHFDQAPIVEVSGRTFPVEFRYRPLSGPQVTRERDQAEGICDAVEELCSEGPGDILVFCSGEREIRDAADALGELALPDTEIFPLFARLSSAEQHRVFASHRGRRVVLATNVAETSLTVPGILSVVDPGKARISRYNPRTKVQRLPIEPVSQASANQRAGRCGRIAPGVCIRLYSEDDFDVRPQFTEPEIQRTNLSSVILQMAALGLGDIEDFPFVQAPDARNIRDGILLLEELGAVDPTSQGTGNWLTPIGRRLARLPIDPRLGRMILEAGRRGCLSEVLIIASGLSIQDPRERPTDKRQAADEHHARFVDDHSDFLGLVQLWAYVTDEKRARSSNQFRRMCRREFLNYSRLREWQDLHGQLRRVARDLGLSRNSGPADPDQIHRALLSGLLSHVGHIRPKDKKRRGREYSGARGSRFAIAPGSALARSGPSWVMAAELVETNRMWARVVAPIEPEWAEELAGALVTRSHDEPEWDESRASSLVHERVTLYGLPLVVGRPVQYVRVAPRHARDQFIEHALVDGRWEARHQFISQNRRVRRELAELQARTRRADLDVDRAALFRFYDERLGVDVASRRAFDRWWKRVSADEPQLLDLSLSDVCGSRVEGGATDDFPPTWLFEGHELRLLYEFDVASESDGVTIEVPVELLGRLSPEPFTWNVPGHHLEVLGTLIRTLPREIRRTFVPIPAMAVAVLDELDRGVGDVRVALAQALTRRSGVLVRPDQFDLEALARYLRPIFLLLDEHGEPALESRDLAALQAAMDERVRATLSSVRHTLERDGLVTWDLGVLPRSTESGSGGHRVRAYPALKDRGDSVDVVLTATPDEQADTHWAGIRRLLRLATASPLKQLDRLLDNDAKLAIASGNQGRAGWYNDAIGCALDAAIDRHGGLVWEQPAFEQLLSAARTEFPVDLQMVADQVNRLAPALAAIDFRLDQDARQSTGEARTDIRRHLERLTYDGFLSGVGLDRLPDVARYVSAIEYRIERLDENVGRDTQRMIRCLQLEAEFETATAELPFDERVEAILWMLEEFRVSVFAQPVGVVGTVSEKRIRTAIARLRSG